MTGQIEAFLNLDDYLGKRVSEEQVRDLWNNGDEAALVATTACVRTWPEDFSDDTKYVSGASLDMRTYTLVTGGPTLQGQAIYEVFSWENNLTPVPFKHLRHLSHL